MVFFEHVCRRIFRYGYLLLVPLGHRETLPGFKIVRVQNRILRRSSQVDEMDVSNHDLGSYSVHDEDDAYRRHDAI